MAKKIKAVFTAGAGYLIPADLATNEYMASELEAGEEYVITITKKSAEVTRSVKLNSSRWLWCRQVAAHLNNMNFTRAHFYHAVINRGKGSAPWSDQAIDVLMWKPTQEAVTGLTTSRLPSPKEYGEIHLKLDEQLMQLTKLTMPEWPSNEPPLVRDYE